MSDKEKCEVKQIFVVTNKTFAVYFESKKDAEEYISQTTPSMGFTITTIDYFAACQKPEQGIAELKCGCGGNVKIEPSDNGRGLDSTCFFINCENENCPLHDNDIFYDTESEAISAFRLATNQAKLDAQAAKIKELQAENVKLRLIVFGYYDQFKNDMGICGLNTEAKEILKGGE